VSAGAVVRRVHERMQARDWAGARACVAVDAVVVYPVSGERFTGLRWMDMNEAYPEGWSIEILEIVEQGDRAAARVRVTLGAEVALCAGFYSVDGERITGATEIWTTESGDEPPEWRRPFWSEPG
jgi:SnoaL-like domain